jgi:antitoxin component HigA of HigAB toxin-antitoxin module
MSKIETKVAYYRAMTELETLLEKGISNHTAEEEAKLDELSDAIEAWENIAFPMPLKPDFPAILSYLMESRKLKQNQLATELGISSGFLSNILNRKTAPNVELLREVHLRYQIDGNMLLESV